MPKVPNPYADAPRLPEGELVDPRMLVGAVEPIELEIGPGKGGFLFERLAAEPEARLVGLEIRLKWAAIVDQKVRELGHGERCRVFAEDARAALPRFVEACLCRVFIQFPDPWWKKRHAKRRLTSDSVFDDVTRLLVDHGELFIQTDVEERIDSFAAIADAHPDLVPFGSEARVSENPYGARTPREHRAIRDGLPIYRLRYRRRARNASGSPPSRPA
jgi:tRNA (guanine-N7-)-methyltransferase